MAITATILCNPTSSYVNRPVTATLTLTNGGTSAINITSIDPLVYPTGGSPSTSGSTAVAVENLPLGPNTVITVPGSGSMKISFNLTFFAPSIAASSYTVGAVCNFADGTLCVPTPTTIAIAAN